MLLAKAKHAGCSENTITASNAFFSPIHKQKNTQDKDLQPQNPQTPPKETKNQAGS